MFRKLTFFVLAVTATGCSQTYSAEEITDRYYEWIENELQSDEILACQADDDCIVIQTGLNCENIKINSCGTVVNRETAGSWSDKRMHDELCSLEVEDNNMGTIITICAGGEPGCSEGRCVIKSSL